MGPRGQQMDNETKLADMMPLASGGPMGKESNAYGSKSDGAVQPAYLQEDFFGGREKILTDQQFEPLELCGCEMKNRYKVGVPDSRNKLSQGSDFLFMHEKSNCCERICCSVNRELSLFLRTGPLPHGSEAQFSKPLLMQMHKPFHCQFCCCCRPEMDVTSAAGTAIGHVLMPFVCCKIYQSVFRPGDIHPTFEVGPVTCCQTGFCCPCCAPLSVPVYQKGTEVARFTHMKYTCCELFGMMNRMQIEFGKIKDPNDRALLFSSMMLLELEYFEYNKNNNGGS